MVVGRLLVYWEGAFQASCETLGGYPLSFIITIIRPNSVDERNPANELRLVVYPSMYRVLAPCLVVSRISEPSTGDFWRDFPIQNDPKQSNLGRNFMERRYPEWRDTTMDHWILLNGNVQVMIIYTCIYIYIHLDLFYSSMIVWYHGVPKKYH